MPNIADIKQKSQLYHYAAYVTDVYDGDTITVDVDLGLGMWHHGQTIRFWKVNTPELRGDDRERGLEVRDFVRGQILEKTILLRTILDRRGVDQYGKFGRLLGEILVVADDGSTINLNELLLERGYAVPFGADGSAVTPQAAALGPDVAPQPTTIACPFCGATRQVANGVVATCPNCLDQARPLGV